MSQKLLYSIIIGGVAALFFLPFLGGVRLFDWDEINFAECSREMIVLKNYLRVHIDFQPFYEKPPFYFWCQVAAMKIFGIGEYAARLPNAICGIITLIYIYRLGEKLYDHRFGLLWAGAYLGSITPHLYFKSGIIDPFFNLFIFIGLVNLIFAYWKKDNFKNAPVSRSIYGYLFVGGLILGMGLLTKGPVAYLIVCLTLGIYWLLQRFRFFITPLQFIFFTVATSLVSLTWYGVETYAHGTWFVTEFLKYNYRLFSHPDAGQAGFPGYHFVVLLVGCFPASIFGIRAFWKMRQDQTYQQDFRVWMIILFGVVLVLFSIVQSKIVHYSSMCYFPLTYLAALTLHQIWAKKIAFNNWMRFGLIFIGGIYILATVALPFLAMHPATLKPLLAKDPFAVANLDAPVHWTGFEALAGIFLLVILVLSIRWFNQKQFRKAIPTLFLGMACFVMLTLIFFVGRIEGYSQATCEAFFERFQGKDVYVRGINFRTYGEHFYSREQPPTNPDFYKEGWFLTGKVDKPTYLITKITEVPQLDTLKTLEKIGGGNGFVFYKRR